MLWQTLVTDVREALLKKLLKREVEALPEIRHLLLKTYNDNATENCIRFITRCEENSSDRILQNYEDVQEPYARSLLCLVLGFRADADIIPFLMRHVEQHFPTALSNRLPSWSFRRSAHFWGLSAQTCIIRASSF